jgi:hypothetical protein
VNIGTYIGGFTRGVCCPCDVGERFEDAAERFLALQQKSLRFPHLFRAELNLGFEVPVGAFKTTKNNKNQGSANADLECAFCNAERFQEDVGQNERVHDSIGADDPADTEDEIKKRDGARAAIEGSFRRRCHRDLFSAGYPRG